jgi:hypothetical protein
LVHGGTTGHDDIGIKIFSDIDISFLDRIEGQFVHTLILFSDHFRLEKDFGASESLVTQGDGSSIG